MAMNWTWNGWSVSSTETGKLHVQGPEKGADLSSDELAALGEVLESLAGLAEVAISRGEATASRAARAAAPAVVAAPAAAEAGVTNPTSIPGEKAAKPGRAAVAPPKRAAPPPLSPPPGKLDPNEVSRSRQGTTLRVDGLPVKRGPRAAAERFSGVASGRNAAAQEAAPVPRASAAKSASATPSAPAASAPANQPTDDLGDVPPQIASVIAALDRRARLLEPLIRWMASEGKPVTMDEIVAEARAKSWSRSDNPAPALNAAMQRQAHLFLRNPDGTFVLRASRPESKGVTRRRGSGARA